MPWPDGSRELSPTLWILAAIFGRAARCWRADERWTRTATIPRCSGGMTRGRVDRARHASFPAPATTTVHVVFRRRHGSRGELRHGRPGAGAGRDIGGSCCGTGGRISHQWHDVPIRSVLAAAAVTVDARSAWRWRTSSRILAVTDRAGYEPWTPTRAEHSNAILREPRETRSTPRIRERLLFLVKCASRSPSPQDRRRPCRATSRSAAARRSSSSR